ncbi:hypothetical protein LAh2_26 [Aeromonas phage LAh2]|uniref:Uncharacterized protein n=1 Tax=Aeromonas phage LAh1 TaxID=2591024 RepID=A0A513ZZ49_9CAUD|nr:hypothetical protein LAh1_27 [Aeromonas phage LAh1]QDH46320.1 hypothetical protein LAh2_26 [Aeromonas phage LAh2]QDH46366.1 hypothetical protein LAh3_30 [Aeromonas phage LAh3]QDH46416.1 hypothetical protein LAh4_32 [Aeromonas phage LAh4]QDH46469.1 hypothetical protein LAh5_33 [Aeromonas phage LAh5]
MTEAEVVKKVRIFEVGDLFIFRIKKRDCCYDVGDFLIIRDGKHRIGFGLETRRTITGACGASSCDADFLNELLDKGYITYEGNLK